MRRIFPILLCLCFCLSCTERVHDIPFADGVDGETAFSGVALIKFEKTYLSGNENDLDVKCLQTKSASWTAAGNDMGIYSVKRLFPYSGKYEERTRAEGLDRWYVIEFDKTITYTKASEDLMVLEGVEIIEPVLPVASTSVFDDPLFRKQWHYYNDGTLSSRHVESMDINVVPAWERRITGKKEVVVAVVDGGIDQNHEDLKENCIGGYNFVRDNEEITPHDHGTHVAGTIAAVNNNGVGVSGIAGGDHAAGVKGVSLLSCQIFEHQGDGEDDSADGAVALKWAADHGAVIANNSWGYKYNSHNDAMSATIPVHLKDAIDYFIKNAGLDEHGVQTGMMKGGLVVFAAGNDGWDTDPIGKYAPVLSVGSSGPDGRKAPYSNYGTWVDISAPGGNIKFDDGLVYSTLPDNAYGGMQGTSMACPHVTGAAALILSEHGGPGFTPDDLRIRLLKGANADVRDVKKIGPLLDVSSSIAYGNKIAPDKVADLKVSWKNGGLNAEWTVTEDKDEGRAYGYKVLLADSRYVLEKIENGTIPSGCRITDVLTGRLSVGEKLGVFIGNVELGRTYYVAVFAYDKSGNNSALSEIVACSTPVNKAPVIHIDGLEGVVEVGAHDTYEFLAEIYDPDGHNVSVFLEGGGHSVSLSEKGDLRYGITIKGDGNAAGDYGVSLSAVDSYGAKSEYVISYRLLANSSPVAVSAIDDIVSYSLGESYSFDMAELFLDPDHGSLNYRVIVDNESVLYCDIEDEFLKLLVRGFGVSNVTVFVSDSYGEEISVTFKVMVKASKSVNVFPNPVSENLFISVPDDIKAHIVISSQSGIILYDEITELSVSDYYKVDMTDFEAGLYYISIKGESVDFSDQIVKI